MLAKVSQFIYCMCAFFTVLGQPSGQPLFPQRFYAVNSDGSISNVSFNSPVVDVLRPSREITIPQVCGNPLQCITPQQNGSSAIYIPNEDNSGLVLLEIEDEMLRAYNITPPCVLNDLEVLPNTGSLLMACVATDAESKISYVLTNRYGTMDNTIQRVARVSSVVSPIILNVTWPVDEGDAGINYRIVSIDSDNNTVTFDVIISDLDVIRSNFPCAPARIQRQRLNNTFLLMCRNNQSYLANIFPGQVNFISLPNSIAAVANNGGHGLVITSSSSTTTVTIQELVTQPAATRTIQLNTTIIYDTGFGPDDRFAYVATDKGVVFINVAMALNGNEEFEHTIPSQRCSQCPPVAFLNGNTVVISTGTNDQAVLLEFFQLWPWPSKLLLSRTLNKQPRWFWFTFSTDPARATDNKNNKRLSDGAITGIVIAFIVFLVLIVLVTVALWQYIKYIHHKKQETDQANDIVPQQNINRAKDEAVCGDHRDQMVPGGMPAIPMSNTIENEVEAVQEAQHAIPAEPSMQTDASAEPIIHYLVKAAQYTQRYSSAQVKQYMETSI